jgi:uncharacterized protein (DUF697 family)
MTAAPSVSSRATAAAVIVQEHAALAMVSSLVPVPFVEFAAVSAIHLNMMEALTREFGVEFRPEKAKALITAILTGCTSRYLGTFLAGNLAKLFPGLGSVIAVITLPSVAGSLTYALGRIFVRHLELGGSLLDFDLDRARAGFLQEVERSRVHPAELARVIGSNATGPLPTIAGHR